MEKQVTDGIVDFSGGMDSNTSPSLLQKNQYVCSVNMRLQVGKRGISTRQGYREIKLNFKNKKQEAVYRSGIIQGCGFYLYGNMIVQVVSCNGYMFELREVSKWEYDVIFTGYQNNPNLRNAYFSNVPDGLIINDGESSPIYCQKLSYRRNTKDELGAGYGGVFIQNRYFYTSTDRKSVHVSSFNNPVSKEESRLNNLFGFTLPDNTFISALGEQKYIDKTSQGGSLVISSIKNIYSVDVRGPMSNWGKNGDIGIVSGDVYDVGASSQYSFLSLNGNVYFRSKTLGLVSLQYLQYIFNNTDTIENQSYGGDLLFNNDDQFLLDSCYSVRYKNKIYTTVAPDINGTGVFWNGIIVCKPQQKGIIAYESLYTGVRPWCICQPDDAFGEEFLYIHSYDHDGVNRMYILDEAADMDYLIGKKPKEIESKLFTRQMAFDNGFSIKKPDQQMYAISQMNRDVSVRIKTRKSDNSSFKQIFETIHKNNRCTVEGNVFVNANEAFGFRESVPYSDASGQFLFKQDLVEILGSCSLDSMVRQCYLIPQDKNTHLQEKISQKQQLCTEELFSYKINS